MCEDNSVKYSFVCPHFVYLTTSEMRIPHYSGHFNLAQRCPVSLYGISDVYTCRIHMLSG